MVGLLAELSCVRGSYCGNIFRSFFKFSVPLLMDIWDTTIFAIMNNYNINILI